MVNDTKPSDNQRGTGPAATPVQAGRGLWRRIHHAWSGPRQLRRVIDSNALLVLETRIRASEAGHTGQIRLCIEGALPASYLRRDATATERAQSLFSKLRVWDTEFNNGVLIYLLVADRSIEVIADRGLRSRVAPHVWTDIVAAMRLAFRTGEFDVGLVHAIGAIDQQLREHYPRATDFVGVDDNQPDRPLVI